MNNSPSSGSNVGVIIFASFPESASHIRGDSDKADGEIRLNLQPSGCVDVEGRGMMRREFGGETARENAPRPRANQTGDASFLPPNIPHYPHVKSSLFPRP
jgi:hypothetical protein